MIEIADDPFCECGDVETIDHVLCKFPILEMTRRRLFKGQVSLSQMVTEPQASLATFHWSEDGVTVLSREDMTDKTDLTNNDSDYDFDEDVFY